MLSLHDYAQSKRGRPFSRAKRPPIWLRMATELHDLTVPVFVRGLRALSGILEKGCTFADEKGLPHGDLIEARLFEDMSPLPAQIQRASDSAKNALIRLGGLDPFPLEDNESSFDELQTRITRTIDFLESVDPAAINGKEDADVVLQTPRGEVPFKGRDYVLGFALPNFYFHVTTAYDILRHKGVPVGKLDYLGAR